jgi:hypothetical protein
MNLDDRIQRAVEAVIQQARGFLEAEVRALADHAVASSAEEREAAVAEAAKARAGEIEEAVRQAREAAQAEHEAALKEMQAAAQRDRDLAAQEARSAAQAEAAAAVAAARAEADGSVAAARAEADGSVAAAKAEADESVAAAKAEAEQKFASVQADAASKLAATETEVGRLTEARVSERQADLACATQLLDVIRRLDRASSLTEILDTLADYAQAEVGRAALFLVHGARLNGWRILGFENVPEDGHGVELDVNAAGVIARAVGTGEPAAISKRVVDADEHGAEGDLPPFLALTAGRAGLAMPVFVAHQVVAVLYTDEGRGERKCTPSAWPEIIEVAARHAGRCLELLTAARVAAVRSGSSAEAGTARHSSDGMAAASGMSRAGLGHADTPLAEEEAARRYARLLVSEIKLYNEAAVVEGKQARNVMARLRPEIERARRLYGEQFPVAFGSRVNCFEEELVKTLADGDASLLGKVT